VAEGSGAGERPAVCLALDVGGTKLAAGLVDASGRILVEDRVRTPRATEAEALYRVVVDLLRVVREAGRREGVGEVVTCGVGCGGPMTGHGAQVSPLNIPAWRDFPLRERLEAEPVLGGVPVALDNDAKALALGEGWIGAAAGHRDFIAMVVSTGVGGGIVLDGRLLEGASGNAGHIGHVVVAPDGRPCACGSRGCLEAEASGSAIEATTGSPARLAPPEVVERTGRLVGLALASVAALLDLRLAVVGGGVALGFGVRFFLAAQRELDARARIAHARGAQVVPVGLGEDAPLVGAAAVGWRGLRAERGVEIWPPESGWGP
jgi:glucokinase